MQPMAQLLGLWSALAAARHAPGRLHILPAGGEPGDEVGTHPSPTVVVALRGVVRLERPRRSPIDLQPGDAAAIAPGAAHRHAPLRRGSATLDLGFDYEGCDLLLRTPDTTVAALLPTHPALALAKRLLDGDRIALPELLAQVLERPLRDVRPLPAAAERMRDRIRTHGLTPISAADVARAGGLAPSRAWQLFKAHFGCTPRQALERRRCAVAASLLDAGVGVAEAARRCGFRDRGTFSRAYVRVHGVTPRASLRGASRRSRRGLSRPPPPGRAR